MSSRIRFAGTVLPPIECFYDTLNDESLDPQDYQRVQQTRNYFNIQNLKQYHDHYLLSDVLLLADVFENIRNTVYAQFGSGEKCTSSSHTRQVDIGWFHGARVIETDYVSVLLRAHESQIWHQVSLALH